MKTRIISGILVIVAMLLTVALSGVPFVLNGIMAAVAAVAVYEIFRVAKIHTRKLLTAGAIVFTAAFVFCSDPIIPFYREIKILGTFLLILAAFTYYLRGYRSVPVPDMAFALVMTLLVASFFSCTVLTRKTEFGFFNLVWIFLLAWIPDTGAYFCGSAFGKHKLAPVISPKKTVEGAVGGLIFCVGVAFLFVWLVSLTGAEIRYWLVPLYAIPGTLISILGDLTASLIKRYYKIKDYGNLIPGHGGIMDRFDSIWFVSPFVYLMISLLPIFS